MERRRIDELIRSSGPDWRAIEKVEKRLHVQSPVRHGVGEWKGELK
jgi:hypothetical protein